MSWLCEGISDALNYSQSTYYHNTVPFNPKKSHKISVKNKNALCEHIHHGDPKSPKQSIKDSTDFIVFHSAHNQKNLINQKQAKSQHSQHYQSRQKALKNQKEQLSKQLKTDIQKLNDFAKTPQNKTVRYPTHETQTLTPKYQRIPDMLSHPLNQNAYLVNHQRSPNLVLSHSIPLLIPLAPPTSPTLTRMSVPFRRLQSQQNFHRFKTQVSFSRPFQPTSLTASAPPVPQETTSLKINNFQLLNSQCFRNPQQISPIDPRTQLFSNCFLQVPIEKLKINASQVLTHSQSNLDLEQTLFTPSHLLFAPGGFSNSSRNFQDIFSSQPSEQVSPTNSLDDPSLTPAANFSSYISSSSPQNLKKLINSDTSRIPQVESQSSCAVSSHELGRSLRSSDHEVSLPFLLTLPKRQGLDANSSHIVQSLTQQHNESAIPKLLIHSRLDEFEPKSTLSSGIFGESECQTARSEVIEKIKIGRRVSMKIRNKNQQGGN